MPGQSTHPHELTLTRFQFPKDLEDGKANFRFVVDLRYVGDKGKFLTEQAVMPSLDTFWECDRGRSDKPNYVRKLDPAWLGDSEGNEDDPKYVNEFEMDAIDPWDRLILRVNGQSLHSIQFKVFDVDRKDGWDKVKGFIGGVIGNILGKAKAAIPELPLGFGESLGGATDDVKSSLLKKLSGGDKLLFRGSARFPFEQPNGDQPPRSWKGAWHWQEPGNGCCRIKGRGTAGLYEIGFSHESS